MIASLLAQAADWRRADDRLARASRPSSILIVGINIVLGTDLLIAESKKWATATITGFVLLAAFVPIVTLAVVGDDVRSLFDGRYVVDEFSLVLKALFLLTAYVVVLISQNELEEGGYYQGEYYVLLLCSVLGMVMMASSRDLVSVFIALELLSIPAYMMAAWRKRDRKSNEAGVKYYLLGVFASAVLLYGMSLLYGATGLDQARPTSAPRLAERELDGLEVVGHRVRHRRLRLQGVGGAVPHVGARHLPGRADAGHRVPVGGVEGGRLRRPRPRRSSSPSRRPTTCTGRSSGCWRR